METLDGLREQLLTIVTEMPGANTRQAAARAGVPESSADYHLRRLVKLGHLTSEFQGRTRHWYAKGCGLCPVLRRATPALRRDETRAVAEALREEPSTAGDLARHAGLTLGSVRWVAGVLGEAGLVQRTSQGRLLLRSGAQTCLGKAIHGQRCTEWGRCPVSLALLSSQAAPRASGS